MTGAIIEQTKTAGDTRRIKIIFYAVVFIDIIWRAREKEIRRKKQDVQ